MKKYILTVFTVLWMIMIFLFSNQEANASSNVSNSFIDNTVVKIYKVFDKDLSVEEENNIKEFLFVPIRKTAHFSVYFILGILVLFTLREYGVKDKVWYYAILICFLYAVSDEIHQLFVAGRSGEVLDVLLDTCGSSIAVFILKYILEKKKFKVINES